MNRQARREIVGKQKKKMQEYDDDPEQPQEHRQQLIVSAACQDSTKSNSVLPLPVASYSDQGQDENASATGGGGGSRNRENRAVEAAHGGRVQGGGGLPPRRHWWGDCLPHVALLREALLSSSPDIAVLGPLHGCFSFYMTHLHNEVLSTSYAHTMTLGANVTRLESAFMWVGGWRPTSALVLVYSLMGIEIENALLAVRAGKAAGETSTSSLLSPRQLAVMHVLQKHTQLAEMRITKKLTVLQMLIGDQDVLEAVLLDAASPVANDSSRFHQVTARRMSRFRRLLVQAEELRLHTLKDLLSLLTPIQAARCGVAVFEMCSALRTMGSTTLPTLPALSKALPVAFPALPALSALGRKTLVTSFDEPMVHDLSTSDGMLNSYDVPHSQSDGSLVSDLSSYDSIPSNSSDINPSQFDEALVSDASSSSSNILNASDVLHGQSDETAILVPSCSNNSSSQLLPQESPRGFDREERSKSLSAVMPLVGLKLDDDTDGMVSAEGPVPRVGNFPGKVISNRLLLLSPASSDVTIQNCSLDSSDLVSYFEMHPQVPLGSADVEETTYQQLSRSSESGDVGGCRHLQPGEAERDQLSGDSWNRISAPWFWSSAQYLKCFLHQKYAEWANDWMSIL
ncbi:unnamed protein product [Calypogeia fissa]